MPQLDATAKTAVASSAFTAVWLVYLDIVGDPLRFTTGPADTVVSGSGDSELDGTYVAWAGKFLHIGEVNNSDNGSDALALSLSGIVSIDTALMNEIGDKSKWQGRTCRIWFRLYDETGATAQGAIVPYYTGYMSSVLFDMAPEEQRIQLSAENWLAAFNAASNRSYLNQKDYDSADTSAAATIAASNGMRRETGGAAAPSPGTPSGGGTPDTGGYGAGSPYTSYSPYPDAPSQYNNPDYTDTSLA